MKSFLKTISLVSLLSVPVLAFGQSPTDMSNFSFRLKLQTRYDFYDTFRKNQMDIFTTTARTGLNYKYKNVYGVIEFQGGSATDASSATASASTSNGQQELFIVRRANVGLELVKSDPATLAFIIGRDHNVSSIVYAPDGFSNLVATNIDNISAANSQDGIALKYKGNFDFGGVDAQVGYYNNFPVAVLAGGSTGTTSQTSPFGTNSKGVGDATYNSQSKSGSRAIAAQVGANVKAADGVVEVRALYSSQPNAVLTSGASTYTSTDTSNIEASVGYNFKSNELKGGVWFQQVSIGKTQSSTGSIVTNDITYANGATDDSYTATTIGLGVTGNSNLFGLNSLLVSGDYLTYGLGYLMVSGQNFSNGGGSGVTAFSNQSVDVNMINIAAGYTQGVYSLELDYIMSNADKEIYAGTDGALNQKTASLFYLVGTIAL
ncbi:hypothetical protein [Fluviispira multicolorata]|uniref:Porin n=1 Tax=Fluviispira multicolorata TaxID=2654512 RepID=A0A833JEI6_9BACT|nr:hypothetical protein [Fluviispira multicolorata]KAB8031924.1 hypothetical protein GCL57_04570 [Fluviispira multicolorata]